MSGGKVSQKLIPDFHFVFSQACEVCVFLSIPVPASVHVILAVAILTF